MTAKRKSSAGRPTAGQDHTSAITAECAVLCAMMLGAEAIPPAAALLQARHFYRTAHAKTFEAVLALHGRGEPVDLVTLGDELAKRGGLEEVGGRPFLSSLLEMATTCSNLEAHARIVLEAARKREMVRLARELAKRAADPEQDSASVIAFLDAQRGKAPAAAGQSKQNGQGTGLALEEDEPAAEPVEDGAGLLNEVASTIRRFMVLRSGAEVALALWVALTYLVDSVSVLPRLLLASATKVCTKTRMMTALGALVRCPLPTSSITASALFRSIEAAAPTLLLDEMDNGRLAENDELRAVLNSGHTPGAAFVLRTVGDNHEVRRFSTWAPVALASIGTLPDTLLSRCVKVRMERRAPGQKVERMREHRLRADLEPLRRRLVRWCQDHAGAIREADPVVPEGLGDRDADNWTPLLAIADLAGGDWPERARIEAMSSSGATDTASAAEVLLADLRDLWEEKGIDRLSSAEVVAGLVALEERPWSGWSRGRPLNQYGLARLLRGFGIAPRNVKLPDGRVPKGYHREDFRDAWGRYLPSPPPSGALNPLPRYQAHEHRPEPTFEPATTSEPVADEKRTGAAIDAGGSGVADEKPLEGGVGLPEGESGPGNGRAGRDPAAIARRLLEGYEPVGPDAEAYWRSLEASGPPGFPGEDGEVGRG